VLTRDRVAAVERVNEAAEERRQQKRSRIYLQGALTKAEGEEIIAQKDVDAQLERERRESNARSGGSRQARARCTRC
jgi:hypothetical protein